MESVSSPHKGVIFVFRMHLPDPTPGSISRHFGITQHLDLYRSICTARSVPLHTFCTMSSTTDVISSINV